MLLLVSFPVPGVLILLLLELALLPLHLCSVGSLELHAHGVKPPRAVELHDMEQVYHHLCLRELLLDNAHHAV